MSDIKKHDEFVFIDNVLCNKIINHVDAKRPYYVTNFSGTLAEKQRTESIYKEAAWELGLNIEVQHNPMPTSARYDHDGYDASQVKDMWCMCLPEGQNHNLSDFWALVKNKFETK